MARKNGLCDEWFGKWREDMDDDELLNMYVKGIDFSIEKDWVSNDFAKENFDADTLAEHGIFIDRKELVERNLPNLILNGTSEGRVDYDHFNVGNVYARHGSRVKVIVWDFAKVFIEMYDDAEVDVVNYSNNRVFVYKHGGKVTCEGDVLVRKK